MRVFELKHKLINRIWAKIVRKTRKTFFYTNIYRSYWHSVFYAPKIKSVPFNYYCAIPNPGAGIGHQLANWISGYWYCQQFRLQFAHIPFSNPIWESFLGFGEGEKRINELVNRGYRKVKLPLFDEYNVKEVELQKKIIQSYFNKKVVFVAEQDQFYKNQFGVIDLIQEKFYKSPSRKNDTLIYEYNTFNVAIHVRRGDIVIGQVNNNTNHQLRWQGNDYFVKVLQNVLNKFETNKTINIYLFSQGEEIDFSEFIHFKNLHFCLDMNPQDSFLHMVFADVLITSKSSFSYKPALLNRNIKVCPKDFWHGYPQTKDWIISDENGDFNYDSLLK